MNKKSEPKSEIPEWAKGDPLMEWYATKVWGKKISDDDKLFEIMSLQIFQAGLTWRLILTRWDAFRKAFKNWNIDKVSSFNSDDVERLLNDASIIRNKMKIEACIDNARIIQTIKIEHNSFCNWFYNELEGENLTVLQKKLKKKFKFIGPEIARMWLMASGRISPDIL